MKRISDEIFFGDTPVVAVDRSQVDYLKAQANANSSGKSRLCAHSGAEEKLHDMIIVHARGAYVRPHRHLDRGESLHVIEGTADVFLFEDDGTIRSVVPVGDAPSGQAFFFRVSLPVYHCLRVTSDALVFHEATTGPFEKQATVYAPWSPVGPVGDEVTAGLSWLAGPRKAGDPPPR